MMVPADNENGIVARVAVLESEHHGLQKDLTEIKGDVKEIRVSMASRTWSRSERISFGAVMVATCVGLIVAAGFILNAVHG
jgi:hypothetical protein